MIEAILGHIERTRQGMTPDRPPSLQEKATIGYLLHNLYTVFESIFKNIARTFGNTPGGTQTWHAALLRRMTLEIEGVRPRVIGSECYHALDELRRFRHLFRHAYTLELDWDRMELVLHKLNSGLRPRYREEMGAYLRFLEDMSA